MKTSPKLLLVVVIVILLFLVVITLLLPLPRGFSPMYSTEHIPKYRSIENFMKLPFQRVVDHPKRSPNEWVMVVSILALRAVQKISECTTFNVLAIPTCRNLRLTWFLIRWNGNFVELLSIQKYSATCFWGQAECWWEQCLLVSWSEDVNELDLVVLWSVMLCIPRLSRSSSWITSEYHGYNDESSPWFLLFPRCPD